MCFFFVFTATAPTEIYTLSLHDALPIFTGIDDGDARTRRRPERGPDDLVAADEHDVGSAEIVRAALGTRSEEHTSELQSRRDLVCRLLLEKKKKQSNGACGQGDRRRTLL